ncbi:MAG TPA: TonB-dependent receptor plug domain-containing protein, partial [Segetibacter sp.]
MKRRNRGSVQISAAAIFFFIVFISSQTSGQTRNKATVKGKTFDSLSLSPLSFSTIKIYHEQDKKAGNESIANEAGEFSVDLNFGRYYAVIDYMGYKTFRTPEFSVTGDQPTYNLGVIKMVVSPNTLKEVVVQAEKSSMQLSLDKKIFNVGKDLANAGGSASDILTNIPSVSVDPEGNVKLRGSDNVRILIDGKPSGLVSFKGGSGLQQLQASMIDRVEIITNPSARYEAEGMAGIINIILKKDKRQGFNGSFELTTGYPTNLG